MAPPKSSMKMLKQEGWMSNKSTFKEACDLFNKQDWDDLVNKLDLYIECHYLNPSTAPTYTRRGFIKHQKDNPQKERFDPDPKNQWWNHDQSVVAGIGTWTDDGTKANGLINYMWGDIL
jgi:hypothetical protein